MQRLSREVRPLLVMTTSLILAAVPAVTVMGDANAEGTPPARNNSVLLAQSAKPSSSAGLSATSSSGGPRRTAGGTVFGHGRKPRILALGDSITYGYNGSKGGGTGGYRPRLWKDLKARGHAFSPVGPLAGPPNGSRHAGYPGERIRDIARGVPGVSPSAVSMMKTYSPDVVLLHIGTNDFSRHDDMSHAANRADALIDSLVKARPGARIFVARIINSYVPVPVPEVSAYNNAVEAHVKALAARGKHVYSVNEAAAVTKAFDLGDGVHPKDTTYARMARIWAAGLERVNAGLK